ncbi:hypothetical protein HHK36_016379 [Tetracentron sinense]|uniref:WRKY domain-containing protein n=1 Tax=Tetracentron sinense TaxID=13715 RepID=A0A834Z5P1_TETSI|nr:hypothetical protein HHK36_016379 [Tetracentron sinense]
MEAFEANWSDGLEDELVRELLDNESPLFVLPPETNEPEPSLLPVPMFNRLVPTIYSGPTIEDIENALSATNGSNELRISQARISILEKGSKIADKYTLKIKNCGNGMTDDGYKWRKYGQKSIKNSPNPR